MDKGDLVTARLRSGRIVRGRLVDHLGDEGVVLSWAGVLNVARPLSNQELIALEAETAQCAQKGDPA